MVLEGKCVRAGSASLIGHVLCMGASGVLNEPCRYMGVVASVMGHLSGRCATCGVVVFCWREKFQVWLYVSNEPFMRQGCHWH